MTGSQWDVLVWEFVESMWKYRLDKDPCVDARDEVESQDPFYSNSA